MSNSFIFYVFITSLCAEFQFCTLNDFYVFLSEVFIIKKIFENCWKCSKIYKFLCYKGNIKFDDIYNIFE